MGLIDPINAGAGPVLRAGVMLGLYTKSAIVPPEVFFLGNCAGGISTSEILFFTAVQSNLVTGAGWIGSSFSLITRI